MNTSPTPNLYKHHRFPVETIRYCIWPYNPFSLSYRDVEELMADRGVALSHEAVRYRCRNVDNGFTVKEIDRLAPLHVWSKRPDIFPSILLNIALCVGFLPHPSPLSVTLRPACR